MTVLDLDFVRRQFPSFADPEAGPWAFFENAGGSYVPQAVVDRMSRYLSTMRVQHGAEYDLSRRATQAVNAAADLMAPGKKGYPRVVRTLRSRDLSGDALQHFGSTPVSFAGAWRLGELVFRILFKGDGKRQPQVTVKLRPPGVVQFRRTQHEARVMKLIERNGLMNDRDDFEVVDAAE